MPGHDGKPREKVKMIELLDLKFFSFLREFIEKNKCKLVVTADHVTSCRQKAHTSGAVPVLFWNPADYRVVEKRFSEREGMKGRKILGRKLLEKTLFGK